MDIFKIFKSDTDGMRKWHVQNLITVAVADGHIEDEEWSLLVALAKKMDISEARLEDIKENREEVKFVPPKTYEAKMQQIEDLVQVMTADADVSERELSLCKTIAVKLDLLPQVVDDVVDKAIKKKQ
jgi:uncharacterized tellurite resistance protein B-like protein